MKDKSVRKTSISDLLLEHQAEEKHPLQMQAEKEASNIKEDGLTEQEVLNITAYNQNITTLDELYSKITPLHDIIVRVYLIEPKISESGLMLPYKDTVPVSTQNGMAKWAEVTHDFPYATKAVVVSVPHGSNLEPGMIVQISPNQVRAEVIGQSNNATIHIKNAFVHVDKGDNYPPKNVTDRHYGYLMVPYYEIKAIL